jgi:starch-binding outer membrane protein, SusD/RagB family
MKTINKYILILIFGLSLGACSEKVLDLEDPTSPTDATFFQTEEQLEIALAGIYGVINVTSGIPINLIVDHITDLGMGVTPSSTYDVRGVGEGNIIPSSVMPEQFWELLYRGIQRSNNLLENMSRAESESDPERFSQIKAEAQFLRAYFYHYLIEFYGDVPLRTTVAKSLDEAIIPRNPKAEIVDLLLTDLESAGNVLPERWTGADLGRVSASAANALRARIALYQGNWTIAQQASQEVIASAAHSLAPDYSALMSNAQYSNTSDEVLLSVFYQIGIKTSTQTQEFGPPFNNGFAALIPTQQLIDSYETVNGLPIDEDGAYDPTDPFSNRDPRLKASVVVPQEEWVDVIFETHIDSTMTTRVSTGERITNPNIELTTGGTRTGTGYLWKKFVQEDKLINNDIPGQSDFPIPLIRYAEVLLTYAEAKIENGAIDQSVLDAINDVRARAYGTVRTDVANYPEITSLNQDDLRKVIRRERKVELAVEGFRWFDLRRWGIAEKAMSNVIGAPSKGFTNMGSYIPSINDDGIVDYTGAPIGSTEDYRVAQSRIFLSTTNLLFPIPQREREASGGIVTQNPGYVD